MSLVILGLGNPGNKYIQTRHNIGHWFVDQFSIQQKSSFRENSLYYSSSFSFEETTIHLMKSKFFMNQNGLGLSGILKKLLRPDDIFMVVHDEINLPFLKTKLSQNKSAGGHRGVSHVMEQLGCSPMRLRIGIGSNPFPHLPLSKFVLSKFSTKEQESLNLLFPYLVHSIKLIVTQGISSSLNFTNRYPLPQIKSI